MLEQKSQYASGRFSLLVSLGMPDHLLVLPAGRASADVSPKMVRLPQRAGDAICLPAVTEREHVRNAVVAKQPRPTSRQKPADTIGVALGRCFACGWKRYVSGSAAPSGHDFVRCLSRPVANPGAVESHPDIAVDARHGGVAPFLSQHVPRIPGKIFHSGNSRATVNPALRTLTYLCSRYVGVQGGVWTSIAAELSPATRPATGAAEFHVSDFGRTM